MARRTLVLVRHAKAAAEAPEQEGGVGAASDHLRRLTSRGERDARALGAYLREGGAPDLVLCSTATRTRATWDLAEEELGRPTTVRYEPSLYLASTGTMLGMVRGADDEVARLVVVGHNPATHELALRLTGSGDEAARKVLAGRFPTCGAAVLQLDGRWDSLADGTAELVDYRTPG